MGRPDEATNPSRSDDQTIGYNVHELLFKARATQNALAVAMGLEPSVLSKKLRGNSTWSGRHIRIAAEFLGVDPGRLFREVTLPKSRPYLIHSVRESPQGSGQIPLLLAVPAL